MNFFLIIQRLLFLVLVILLLVITGITLWAFASRKAAPGNGLRKTDPSIEEIAMSVSGSETVFSEIGRLRAITSDNPPVPVIITPFFPYPSGDIAFQEELLGKTRSFRVIFQQYISSSTRDGLLVRGEDTVKKELLALINAELVLGSIDKLYFSEYIFLE